MYIFSSGMVQVHAIIQVFEGGYVCIRYTFCTNMLFRWFWKALACRELVEALFALCKGNNQSKIPCFSFHIVGKRIKNHESIQLTKFMTWIVEVQVMIRHGAFSPRGIESLLAASQPPKWDWSTSSPRWWTCDKIGNFLYSVDTASEDSSKWSNGSIWLSWLRWIVT